MLETLRFIQMVQLLKNETSFRIYIVDNCNLSSIREEVSKKINACTFKPIQLQFRQKEAMVNSIKCLLSVKQTKWHLSNHRRQNSTRPPFFCVKWYNQAEKTKCLASKNINTKAQRILRMCPCHTRSKLWMQSFTLDATIIDCISTSTLLSTTLNFTPPKCNCFLALCLLL